MLAYEFTAKDRAGLSICGQDAEGEIEWMGPRGSAFIAGHAIELFELFGTFTPTREQIRQYNADLADDEPPRVWPLK